MIEQQGNWHWSDNDENWSADNGPYDTRDDALEAGRAELEEEHQRSCRVWTGQRTEYTGTIDADSVIENLGEQAYEEVGDHVGDWPSPDAERKVRFQAALDAAVALLPAPTFFKIDHVESHEPKEQPADA